MFISKKFTALLFTAFFTALQLQAQTIQGTVEDTESGEPLFGATLLQKGTDNGTVTDESGAFRLELLPDSESVLSVRFVGYQPKTILLSDLDGPLLIRMTPSALQGDEIFVDGVRVDAAAPVTQTTIERFQIEQDNIGQDPIYTLEKLTPSVLTHSDSGTRFANYGYMRLRGMDQTRINMTLNGIPLNDMIDQGVFFSNFNDFGNSIQSVQVQRGVGTSTHGTASYAGSVNFESKNIMMGEPAAVIKLTGGSFNSYRISSEVNTGSVNNFGLHSRFSKTGSDGYRFNSGTESASFFISGGYFGNRDILKVTAFAGQTKNELAYDPVSIELIREEPRTNTISEHDKDDFSQQFLQLQYGRSLTNRLAFTSSLYYGGAGGDFPVGFTGEDGEFIQQVFGIENDHYGAQSSLQYTDTNRLNLSGGLHIYRFNRTNSETYAPLRNDPYYRDNSRKDEISAFVKSSYRTGDIEFYGDLQLRTVWLELNPDEDFLIQNGADLTSYNIPVRNWTFLSPKAGITYFINPRFNVYGSFGHSGREPTRHDILGSVNINPGNLEIVSNPGSVKAEYVHNFEGGFRFRSSAFAININGFYMQFKNEISPTGDFIPEGFVQVRENIPESYRAGIETEWQWAPDQAVTLAGNATWMQSRIKEFTPGDSEEVFRNMEPVLSPAWLANGMVTVHLSSRVDVSLSGRYMGEAFLELTNQPNLVLPSFFVTDMGLNTRFGENVSASIKVHNLFDKLYFTNGAPVDANLDGITDSPGYIVQPPRHAFMELQIQF